MQRACHRILVLRVLACLALWLAGPAPSAAQSVQGLLREVYLGIPGNSLADLTNAVTFPDNPNQTNILTEGFETPLNFGENYGQRLRGFIIAPFTGDYFFWIASDDQSALFLGTDDDPATRREIAAVNGWTGPREWELEPDQKSARVRLVAGRAYYIEALMKEGAAVDHLSVRWQLPNGAIEEPIPASRLVPYGTPMSPPIIRDQPKDQVAEEGRPARFSVRARNTDPVGYQWFRNGVPIAGANFAGYTNAAVSIADHGAVYRCVLTNALGSAASAEARLQVMPDRTPPLLLAATSQGATNVMVRYSEPVLNAARTSNYALDLGARVLSVAYGTNNQTVILTTTPLAVRSTYTLRVDGVYDGAAAANPLAPGSRIELTPLELTPADVGSTEPLGSLAPAADGFNITSGGGDVGGTNDVVLLAYQLRAGDFDLRVRVESVSLSDPLAKAGLMAREDLAANARFALTYGTPGLAGCAFMARTATGAVATVTGHHPVNPPATWLRLSRTGNRFAGAASYDGVNWSSLGEATLTFTNAVYVGLAVTSRNTNQTTLARLREYTAVTPDAAAPGDLATDREPLGPSSRRTGLAISEIMYRPAPRPDGRDLEFVELYNSQPFDVDLGGMRLNGDVRFEFPAGTRLAGGAFVVVAANPADFTAVHGGEALAGGYTGRLRAGNGQLQLVHRLGAILLEARYGADSPFPVAADGAGHSLVLARPSYGEANPRAWAASELMGGSPGRLDPLLPERYRGVCINEFLAHTDDPELDYIELYHRGSRTLDLGGCILTDDPAVARFVIPRGVQLAPGGLVALTQIQLGFALRSSGETLYLLNPDRTRVLDAARFGAVANGVASGRFPDGASGFHELSAKTPGAPNAQLLIRPVVINEIMYHPPSNDDRDEFLELHNRGAAAVDVGGWRLSGGIEFTFPAGTRIEGGGFLVVAADPEHLRAAHPHLEPGAVVGGYQGTLGNNGEHLILAMPDLAVQTNAAGLPVTNRVFIAVDEVSYGDGGRWGRWSDGGGSSLELIDARADNRLAANWSDSDESRKATWVTIEGQGRLDHGSASFGADSVMIILQGEGECLIDEVEVDGPTGNLVPNGGFEAGLADWVTRGTHVQSAIQTGEGAAGTRSLRLVATGRGDTGPNQVVAPLTTPLAQGFVSGLRLKARWLRGHPELLIRLHGNWLEAHGRMTLPANLGTPGLPNSRATANAGPAIYDVIHQPVLPAPHEPIRIITRVHDPDGIASLVLRFRYDPSVTLHATNLVDNGTQGDVLAGDGLYTATVPGVAAGHRVAFHVEASDNFFLRATRRFPADAPKRECLVTAGEPRPSGGFGVYRIWFTEAVNQEWTSRHPGSNEPLDATFVYGDSRVVYNVGAYYSGSPFHWRGYSGPTAGNCNYAVVFPGDDLFLGTTDFILNSPANLGNDSTGQREQTAYWMADRLGRPATNRRYVHLLVNGQLRGSGTSDFIFEDVQQPNRDMVEQWFPQADQGELYKIEDWFEYDDAALGFSNVDASLQLFTTTGGAKKLERYRWGWRKRAVEGSASDYASLFALVDAVNTPATLDYTAAVTNAIDLGDWFKTIGLRHAVGDWDAYGYRRGKNMYAYKPQAGPWHLLDWDIAFAFGQGDGPTTDPFSTIEPVIRRMFEHAPLRRAYLQVLLEIADIALEPVALAEFVDRRWDQLRANGVNVGAPTSIKSYAATRRGFLRGLLATNSAPFQLTSHDGQDFTTNRNLIRLEGRAPIDLAAIRVNGVAYRPEWPGVSHWTFQIPIGDGLNRLTLEGLDRAGRVLSNATAQLTVTYTGPPAAIEDHLVFNEIMYHAAVEGAEFLELHNTSSSHAFDLSGLRIEGIDYAFPDGTSINPLGYLVLAKDPSTFAQWYGTAIPTLGPFAGNLARGGETLRLVRPATADSATRPIDEVTYDDQAPWPEAADGQGPSLQLIDPYQDNSRVANWTVATPAATGAEWEYATLTAPTTGSTLRLYLSGPGTVYLDDLALVAGNIPGAGPNLLRNGGFETDLAGTWIVGAAHAATRSVTEPHFAGQRVLELTASQPGSPDDAGSVRQTLGTALSAGQNYTLSFWYLRAGGAVELSVRAGDSLVWKQLVQAPALAAATPGSPNSVQNPIDPFPDLWLNEVLPENRAGATDPAGDRDPWIELHNRGPEPVALAGYSLSDSVTNLSRWTFPATATIPAGGFAVVWLDAEPFETTPNSWHADFRIPPGDGTVVLARSQGGRAVLLDALVYRAVPSDRTFGNIEDGVPRQRQILARATPGTSNLPGPPVTLRINEWMAANTATVADPADNDFDDWFEIHNPGDLAVDLTGFTLTDVLSNPGKFSVPSGYIVPPHGFLLVWADEETRQNRGTGDLHTNFRLSQSGEEIGLFDPTGTLLDSVRFGPQTADASEGRYPDASSLVLTPLPTATPGSANAVAAGGAPRILEAVLGAAGFELTWASEPGARYRVEIRSGLGAGGWQALSDAQTATGSTAHFVDRTTTGISLRFYRVTRLP